MVVSKHPDEREDGVDPNWSKSETESFWVAETLKYLYLIFDDVSTGSLDDWVYSTEGHLFKRPQSRLG